MSLNRRTRSKPTFLSGVISMRNPVLFSAIGISAIGIAAAAAQTSGSTIALGTGMAADVSISTAGDAQGDSYYVAPDGTIRFGAPQDAATAEADTSPVYTISDDGSIAAGDVAAPMMVDTMVDTMAAPAAVDNTLYGFDQQPVGMAGPVVYSDVMTDDVMTGDVMASDVPMVDMMASEERIEGVLLSPPVEGMVAAPVFEMAPAPVFEVPSEPVMMAAPAPIETMTASETVEMVTVGAESFDYGMAPDVAVPAYEYAPIEAVPAPVTESYVVDTGMAVESYTVVSDTAPLADIFGDTMLYDAPGSAAPVESSHNAIQDVLPHAPLSGMSYAVQGDGSFGPSRIDLSVNSAAAQKAELFIGKSTIVTLPAEATEVVVSDPTVVRVVLRTAKQSLMIGLKPGSTDVTYFDDVGNQILSADITVGYDLRALREALARAFPNTPLNLEMIPGELIVEGVASSPSQADAIRSLIRRYLAAAAAGAGLDIALEDVSFVDQIKVATDDQVLVKVRIAEMRRSVLKQFGVDFNLASDAALATAANQITAGGVTSAFQNAAAISNAFNANGTALGGIAARIAGSFEGANIGGLVRAFEQHNVMRVLAEPTLAAVSGETASFLAGGEFPFPTSVENGEVGFTYRDFGVALEFTPVVLDGGRISLAVATEISELTNEGALNTGSVTIPGISVRRANTVVELPSGGTMSIAGLLQQRDIASHTGLPGLKNVPVVGQLFSSSDFLKQETEVVILVTPYLVKPGQEKEFRLPTDGFAPASDYDLFLLGRIHKVYGDGDENVAAAREALKSPLGFIVE